MEGPLPCNTFYPHSSQGTRTWLLDSLLTSQAMGKKQKRTFRTPVSPWEISDTYSGLQMSATLTNTPKIKFLRIRFLRIALKNQQILAEVVLQNRQELGLLIPKQGGTCAMLNETCCSWVNTSSQVKSHSPQEKHSFPTGSQRTSWRTLRTALKSQHSLAGFVLQNRQEIDLLIPEQGGTWAILNETFDSG